MKYLLRTLLAAALPYLIRELVKRMNTPARVVNGNSRSRRPVVIEGEKLT